MVYNSNPPPPPVVTTSVKLRVNAVMVENQTSEIPILALPLVLPFLLPYLGLRWLYRKATGYAPPATGPSAAETAAELVTTMNEICTGSGSNAAEDGNCPVCSKSAPASGGKLLTHQR